MRYDELEKIDVENFYDPLLDEENIEIDYDYVEYCLDIAGRIIAKYKKLLE